LPDKSRGTYSAARQLAGFREGQKGIRRKETSEREEKREKGGD